MTADGVELLAVLNASAGRIVAAALELLAMIEEIE